MKNSNIDGAKELAKFYTESRFLEHIIRKQTPDEVFKFLIIESYKVPEKLKSTYEFFAKESFDTISSSNFDEILTEGKDESKTKDLKTRIQKTISELDSAVELAIKSKNIDDLKKLQEISKSIQTIKKEAESKTPFGIGKILKVIWFLVKLAMGLALVILGPIAIYTILITIGAITATLTPYIFTGGVSALSLSFGQTLGMLGIGTGGLSGAAGITAATTSAAAATGAGISAAVGTSVIAPLAGVGVLITTSIVVQIGLASLALVAVIIALTYKIGKLNKEEKISDEDKDMYIKELQIKSLEIKKVVDKNIK